MNEQIGEKESKWLNDNKILKEIIKLILKKNKIKSNPTKNHH